MEIESIQNGLNKHQCNRLQFKVESVIAFVVIIKDEIKD